MTDQATSLRKLKQKFDSETEVFSTPQDLLKSLPRPCPFPSVALVIVPSPDGALPNLLDWLPVPLPHSSKAGLWDLARVLPIGLLAPRHLQELDASLIHIEVLRGGLWLLPQHYHVESLDRQSLAVRLRELRHLVPQLHGLTELWMTFSVEMVRRQFSLLASADAACHLVPDHPDAILQGYEAVKAINLSGFFGPQIVVVIEREPIGQGYAAFQRLHDVSKKFLGLDLIFGGVICSSASTSSSLSGNGAPCPSPEVLLPDLIQQIRPTSRDFLYSFCESLLFPPSLDPIRPYV